MKISKLRQIIREEIQTIMVGRKPKPYIWAYQKKLVLTKEFDSPEEIAEALDDCRANQITAASKQLNSKYYLYEEEK